MEIDRPSILCRGKVPHIAPRNAPSQRRKKWPMEPWLSMVFDSKILRPFVETNVQLFHAHHKLSIPTD